MPELKLPPATVPTTFSVDVLVWDLQVNFHHVGLFPRSTEHTGEISRLQTHDKNIFSYSCFNIRHSISVFVEIFTSPPYLTQVDFMEVPLLSQGTDTNVTIFPIQEQGLINVS